MYVIPEKLKTRAEIETFSDGAVYFEKQIEKTRVVECEDCKIVVIKAQFQVHLKSRRHKKRLAGIRKRLKNAQNMKISSENDTL